MYCILYVCIYIYICIWLNSDKSTCIYNGVSGLYFWLVSPNYTNDSQPHPPILDLGPSAPVDSWNKDSSRHGSATIPQMLQSPSVVNVATREKTRCTVTPASQKWDIIFCDLKHHILRSYYQIAGWLEIIWQTNTKMAINFRQVRAS